MNPPNIYIYKRWHWANLTKDSEIDENIKINIFFII